MTKTLPKDLVVLQLLIKQKVRLTRMVKAQLHGISILKTIIGTQQSLQVIFTINILLI